MNRLAGISYKQLAELAERYSDENQGMSLVIVFIVPDESAKKAISDNLLAACILLCSDARLLQSGQ